MPLPEVGGLSESTAYDTPSAFDPYDPPEDPEPVQSTSPSPAPVEPSGDIGGTSEEDGEPQEAPQGSGGGEEAEAQPEFDPRHREDFTGLLYLGRLQRTFTLYGHRFVVKTLTTEELAEIGVIVKPYAGTNVENAVYQSAVVAASVVTVDGQPLPGAITIDTSMELTAVRFPYVMRNWMPAVREAVYNKTFALELTVRQVLSSMGEASG